MQDKIPGEKEYFFDKQKNIDLFLRVFYVICVMLFLLDFVVHRHTMFKWEELTGFYAIFGFVAFVVLVEGSKILRKLVMRKEDYYDVDE